jgi:hypothetical protein
VTLFGWAWGDYQKEARPALDALLGGHLLRFLHLAPAYGGSLVLRSPFGLIPKLWGGGELAIYRAAAAPCLAASAILGVWLVSRMRALGRANIARGLALLLCVANPITLPALEYGHPEELLGAVLCVGAVIVAMGNRPIWAGVLLGLAVANKEWALVAAGPVLIALPERRVRALFAAGAVAVAVLAPLAAAGGFITQVKGAATQTGEIFTPWQVWWLLGSHAHLVRELNGSVKLAYYGAPTWVATIAHQLIVAIAVPLSLLAVWLRRVGARRPTHEGLLLLMLVLLLRCAIDPWDISYYWLPFLLALVVWEAIEFERPPVLALFGSGAVWFVLEWATPIHGFSSDIDSLLFLAFALPALVAICAALYAPGLGHRVALRMRRRPALARPAPRQAELA